MSQRSLNRVGLIRLSGCLGALLALLWAASPVCAQDDVPVPGTIINASNWQKYKDYFTVGLQAEMAGQAAVKLPDGWSLEVGQYKPIPEPRKYVEDTERYSGQVILRQLPTGGFVPDNYVAGFPFPNPTEPNKGIKALYDMYYDYKPYLIAREGANAFLIDKHGSINESDSITIQSRFMHISDVGMPVTLPGAPPGYFYASYIEQTAPEESKYAVVLTMFPADPSKTEDFYLYVPSLRRSLRSSSASRCAPANGTDLFNDDLNGGFQGIPTEHNVTYLNSHPILNIFPAAITYPSITDFYATNLGWPKPQNGKWVVEPVHRLDAVANPLVLPGYCYSKKTLYLDANQFQLIAVDYYDKAGNLWKAETEYPSPLPIPGTNELTYNSFLALTIVATDLQNSHTTLSHFSNIHMNQEAPAKYKDVSRYATPAGLDQIMQ